MFIIKCLMTICFILILIITDIYPMGQRIGLMPMKPAKLEVQDGEALKYIKIGEGLIPDNEMYFVSKIRNDPLYGKVVDVYLSWSTVKKMGFMPSNYTNYQDKFTVSLNEASLIYNKVDNYSNNVINNEKGVFYELMNINKKENIAEIETKSWNGYEIRQSRSKVKIKPGFPVFDFNSLGYVGSRYLDIKGLELSIYSNLL